MLQSAQSVQCFGKNNSNMRFVLLELSKDQVIAWPKTGSYTFQLDSDDGSRMFLEGAWKELRIFLGGFLACVACGSCWLYLIISLRELQIGVVPQFLVLWFRHDSFQVSKSLIMHLGYKEDFCTKRPWHQWHQISEKSENQKDWKLALRTVAGQQAKLDRWHLRSNIANRCWKGTMRSGKIQPPCRNFWAVNQEFLRDNKSIYDEVQSKKCFIILNRL